MGALSDAAYAVLRGETANHRATTFYVNGVAHDFIARQDAGTSKSSLAWCFNRETKRFLPINFNTSDPLLDTLSAGGVSAVAYVGRFLLIAGNTVVPTWAGTERWGTADNRQHVACWVRGGAYARTFKITLTKTDGSQVVASYKTLTNSYPELLDTTDLSAADTDYQKKVNDRVNAYNSAATKWIGTAAADVTPENIAQKLADSLVAQGITATRKNGTVTITDPSVVSGSGDDGGDNSLLHVVASEVTAPELVSTIHWAGKVVKVQPRRSNGDDAFYLEAVPKEDAESTTGWTQVYWRECAGYKMQPLTMFAIGTVKDGTLHIAGTPAGLAAMTGVEVPTFTPSAVGDQLTSILPNLFGKTINYLGTFQDRLVIGSEAVVMFSRPGDYFNLFRQSVLTVADDDPVEEYALGSEFDTIVSSASYDRDLILFGKNHWYAVSGRQPITPKSNSIVVLRSEPDTAMTAPRAAGNFVFYTKPRDEGGVISTHLWQVQAGLLADSPEGSDNSTQLDTYIAGHPREIVPLTNSTILRTTGSRQRLYVYAYLDNAQNGQRLFDSWSSWTFSEKVGELVAISRDGEGLLAFVLRRSPHPDGTLHTWLACERFTMATTLAPYPHLDSLRPYTDYIASTRPFDACAYQRGHARAFMGAPSGSEGSNVDTFGTGGLWAGMSFDAYVTPTNPYVRDRNGQAILTGRLTLGAVALSYKDSGGLKVEVTSRDESRTAADFNGRILGDPHNIIGHQPIVAGVLNGVIGKEVRECAYTIRAKTWLPATVTAIEWVGQFFNNAKRS